MQRRDAPGEIEIIVVRLMVHAWGNCNQCINIGFKKKKQLVLSAKSFPFPEILIVLKYRTINTSGNSILVAKVAMAQAHISVSDHRHRSRTERCCLEKDTSITQYTSM